MKKILITDTTLRDAHQSLMATRMRTADMLPICERLDKVGFFSLEVWGGATFDVCIRFLNEDPWLRIRSIKERLKNTRTQMLLRGQNLVGYKHYSDDVSRKFIFLSVKNGVDIFRIFDALNDIRNMEVPIRAVKDEGAHAQGTISYTTSPVHTITKFVDMAKELQDLGCDSICIKDMAGLISPQAAYDLVSAIKKEVDLHLALHSHCTGGLSPLNYLAAIWAGVDSIDTAFSPFSGGSSQASTESVVAALKDSPYDPGLDLKLLVEIGYYFLHLKEKYRGLISSIAEHTDVNVLIHQIPGGMLSNFHSQLKEQNALDRYQEVLEETTKVRKDLGYPPLVTPASQIVGMQAVLNVLTGKRYERVSQETKDYCLGLYGRSPANIDPEVKNKVIGDAKPIECRPADLLKPQLEELKEEATKLGILRKEEDLITYILYPAVAVKFLKGELQEEPIPTPKEEVAVPTLKEQPTEFEVTVDEEVFRVKVVPLLEGEEPKKKLSLNKKRLEGAVLSPMQGLVTSLKVKLGDRVATGDGLLILEAMKMQNEITAQMAGTIQEIYTFEGETVSAGDILLVIEQEAKC